MPENYIIFICKNIIVLFYMTVTVEGKLTFRFKNGAEISIK